MASHRNRMQGLFEQVDDCPYFPYERDAEHDHFRDVMMERDIGPFKKGEMVSYATYNHLTGEVWLESLDDNDRTVDSYKFTVKVSYEVLPLARTDGE